MFLLCFVFTLFFGHITSRTANVDDLSDIFDPFPASKTYRSFLDDLDSVFNPLLNVLELQEEEELGPVISPHRESSNGVETNNSETNTGPCDDRCGLSYSNRVVGGQNADIGMFPGYVGIKIRTLIGEIRCGGALIKRRYIITAAHCFHSQNILFATLFFAYSDYTNPSLTGEEQTMVITKKNVIMHENFDKTIWKNDIALIHLERPVTFTDKLIPMCLASGKENLDKVPVIVAGFGTVSKGGHSSNSLRYTRLLTIPNEQCSAWPHMKYVREETICAGAKDRDSCQESDDECPDRKRATINARSEPNMVDVNLTMYVKTTRQSVIKYAPQYHMQNISVELPTGATIVSFKPQKKIRIVELKTPTPVPDVWDTLPLTKDEEVRFIDHTTSVERWHSFVESWAHQAQCYELDP